MCILQWLDKNLHVTALITTMLLWSYSDVLVYKYSPAALWAVMKLWKVWHDPETELWPFEKCWHNFPFEGEFSPFPICVVHFNKTSFTSTFTLTRGWQVLQTNKKNTSGLPMVSLLLDTPMTSISKSNYHIQKIFRKLDLWPWTWDQGVKLFWNF